MTHTGSDTGQRNRLQRIGLCIDERPRQLDMRVVHVDGVVGLAIHKSADALIGCSAGAVDHRIAVAQTMVGGKGNLIAPQTGRRHVPGSGKQRRCLNRHEGLGQPSGTRKRQRLSGDGLVSRRGKLHRGVVHENHVVARARGQPGDAGIRIAALEIDDLLTVCQAVRLGKDNLAAAHRIAGGVECRLPGEVKGREPLIATGASG